MMIARKLAIDELHITEQALPLDNLDQNFIAADALLTPEGLPAQWPKADVIIGNPPFLGAKLLKPERGPDYVNTLRRAYPEVPGMADYCVYWFRKAHDHLPACTADDPVAGRAGLVGTQNIRNNQSRVGGLDYVVKTGTIVEAVENQPWSGEANVHVSIANWVKTQDAALLPKTRKLWFKVEPSRRREETSQARQWSGEQGIRTGCPRVRCNQFGAVGRDGRGSARKSSAKAAPRVVFQGVTPGHEGFVLTPDEAAAIVKNDPTTGEAHFPISDWPRVVDRGRATNALHHRFRANDNSGRARNTRRFSSMSKPRSCRAVQNKAEKEHENGISAHGTQFERWWRHSRPCREGIALHREASALSRLFARHKTTNFRLSLTSSIRPACIEGFCFSRRLQLRHPAIVRPLALVRHEVLQVEDRFRYTPPSVFDTFPWPQTATVKQVDAVASGGARSPPRARRGVAENKGRLSAPSTAPSNSPARIRSKTPTPRWTPPSSPPTASPPRRICSPNSSP